MILPRTRYADVALVKRFPRQVTRRSDSHLCISRTAQALLVVMCIGLMFNSAVWAQFGPPAPSPGGYRPPSPTPRPGGGYNPRPTAPRPGGGYNPGPTTPRPPTPGPRYPTSPGPSRPGQPYRPTPGRPYQPQTPSPQVPGPGQVRNPLYRPTSPSSPANLRFGTSPQTRVYGGPVQPGDPRWRQADQLIRSGQTQQVRSFVQQQVQRDGSLNGLMSAVWALERANVSAPEIRTYRNQAFQLAQQQTRAGSSEPLPYVAVAKFSLEDQNDAAFHNATQGLVQRFPDHPYSHYFQGISALKNADWKTAEQELQKAKEAGIPEESIAHWLKIAIDNQKWIWQYAWATFWVLVAWLAGLVLLYGPGRLLSWLTLRSIRRGRLDQVRPGQRFARTCYRVFVNAAGVYYYVSLPLLVVLSIALPLSIGYALLHVPAISLWLIGLTFLVSIGSILTAFSGLRTCLVSPDVSVSGVRVEAESHPRLWQLARQVADRVGTRCVDQIWLTPSAELGVIERGSFLQRWRDRGERVLVIGIGLLDGFPLRAFQAVLAHEYGHFQHRDTAGGDIALRVNLAMENFAEAITARGKVRWWHVAVHFLRFYYVLFNRLTFGASRLQEVLADRAAVRAYGADAFRDGLSHAIRSSLEHDVWASRQLRLAMRSSSPVTRLLPTSDPPPSATQSELEATYVEILRRPTSEADTHPSPRDRFAYAERLAVPSETDRGSTVWDLFQDPRAVQEQVQAISLDMLNQQTELWTAVNRAKLSYISQYLRQNKDPAAYESRAELHLECGDYRAALRDLERAQELDPSAISVRYLRAVVQREAGAPQRAAEELADLLEQQPEAREPQVYFMLGQCRVESGQWDAAQRAFTECLNLQREARPALLARGRVHRVLGQCQAAIEDFTASQQLLPEASDAYLERALAYRQLQDWNAAVADLQQAATRNVADARIQRELASSLLDRPTSTDTDRMRAVRHARLAAASPEAERESLETLVRAWEAIGDYAAAARTVERMLPLLDAAERDAWSRRRKELLDQANQEIEGDGFVVAELVSDQPSMPGPDLPTRKTPGKLWPVALAVVGGCAVGLAIVGWAIFSGVWLERNDQPLANSASPLMTSSPSRDATETSGSVAESEREAGVSPSEAGDSSQVSKPAASRVTDDAGMPSPGQPDAPSSPAGESRDSPVVELEPILPMHQSLDEQPNTIGGRSRTPRLRLASFAKPLAANGGAARLTEVPLHDIRDHAWSPDGQVLSLLFPDRLWQISCSDLIVRRELRGRDMEQVAWSSEGLLVLQRGRNARISVVDPDTLAWKKTWGLGRAHTPRLFAAGVTPLAILVDRSANEFQVLDTSAGQRLYSVDLREMGQRAFPDEPQAFQRSHVMIVAPGRGLLCGDGTRGLSFILTSRHLQVEQSEALNGPCDPFFGSVYDAATDRRFAARLKLAAEHGELGAMGISGSELSPQVTIVRSHTEIDFGTNDSGEATSILHLDSSPRDVWSACPADSFRWLVRSDASFALLDLLGRDISPDADERFGSRALAYHPLALPKLKAPDQEGEPPGTVDAPVQFENIRALHFERRQEPTQVDAVVSQDEAHVFVRRDRTLTKVDLPSFSVLRQAVVPEGGTLGLTSAGVVVAREDELHLFEEQSLEHRVSYRLPAPIQQMATQASRPQAVFVWSDPTEERIRTSRSSPRLGVVDVEQGRLLLDAPVEDFAFVWQLAADAPSIPFDVTLFPDGRLLCLAWDRHHHDLAAHRFVLDKDHLRYEQNGRLPFRVVDAVVLGPGDNQITIQGRIPAERGRTQPTVVAPVAVDDLTTPATTIPLQSKLFAVDRELGDYYTQGHYSQPKAALVQRVLRDGTLADAFSGSSQVPHAQTVAVFSLATAGQSLVVGRDGVFLVDFCGSLDASTTKPPEDGAEITIRQPGFSAAAASGLDVEYVGSLSMHPETVVQVAFSPDGRWLASAGGTHSSGDRRLQNALLRDAATGEIQHVFDSTYGAMNAVRFSPDGSLLATADQRGTIRLWRPETGEMLREMQCGDAPVCELAWLPDGQRLAVAGKRRAEVWSAEGERLLELQGHTAALFCLTVSPDGRRIATGSADHQLRIWDADDGSELGVFQASQTWITAVAFAPHGRSLAVGDANGNLILRNAETGEPEIEFQSGQNYRNRGVHAIIFSRDGSMLVSSQGRSQGQVKFWNLASREELGTINPLADIVYDVAFSPDERTLALACAPGVVKLFAVSRKSAED